MPDAFIELEELAAYLSPRAPRDLDGDVLAALACEAACSELRTLTGQTLTYVEDDTATFEIGASDFVRELLLPELPVGEVDEVRIAVGDDDPEVSLDWRLVSGGIVKSTLAGYLFPRGSVVEVDYSHGYLYDASAGDFPPELRLLAVTLAARAYQQGISKQESTGGSSVTWSTAGSLDLTPTEKAIVAKYRHRRTPTVEGVPAAS